MFYPAPPASPAPVAPTVRPGWWQFVLWAFIGPISIAGFLAAFTPLIVITGPLSAGLIVLAAVCKWTNASAFGALAGLGAIAIGLGVVGPDYSLFWFGLIGALLITGSIVGFVLVRGNPVSSHDQLRGGGAYDVSRS